MGIDDCRLLIVDYLRTKNVLARISLITLFCFFVVVIQIQAPEFILRTILRRGEDFAFGNGMSGVQSQHHSTIRSRTNAHHGPVCRSIDAVLYRLFIP